MAIWIPGSQSMIAIVTVDTVQVFDISKSFNDPEYFFILPTGKIKDCTFSNIEGLIFLYILTMSGHIYVQVMDTDALAVNGRFYVTNTLDLYHVMITTLDDVILSGGSSIYFSQPLNILIVSFLSGHNFIVSLEASRHTVKSVLLMELPASMKTQSKALLPLNTWNEAVHFPGLILGSTTGNNPTIYAFYLYPKLIKVQEIKITSAKTKVCDHLLLNNQSLRVFNLSLMAVYDDGSFRIFNCDQNSVCFWSDKLLTSPCRNITSRKLLQQQFTGNIYIFVTQGQLILRKIVYSKYFYLNLNKKFLIFIFKHSLFELGTFFIRF